ncbi:MAG TPA: LemA family protein [Candidatus Acidoferrales bacterium]|nr:LemA family protein [Candidatus Acidoferrales bacterium]
MSWMPLLILLFIVGGALAYLITLYNGLIAVKNNVDKAWSNIDVLLKQRHDELPNLLEVCKGYMKYEGETLQRVTAARAAYAQAATVDEKVQASAGMTAALGRLIATAENYPDLKANAEFAHLQTRVSELENEIADRREFYNDSVNTFNTRIQEMPDAILARSMGLERRQMFQVPEADKTPVAISFADVSH